MGGWGINWTPYDTGMRRVTFLSGIGLTSPLGKKIPLSGEISHSGQKGTRLWEQGWRT